MTERLISACYECGSDLGDYDLYGDIEGHMVVDLKYCEVCGRDVSPVLMTESEAEMRKGLWMEKSMRVSGGKME